MAFQLKEWAETNIEQVLAAQMTYDEKSARASLTHTSLKILSLMSGST